jgi:O-antigen ligase
VFLTLATAPFENYLQQLSPNGLSKLPPALLLVAWLVHLLRGRRFPRMHTISWLATALLVAVLASSAINVDNTLVPTYVARWVPFLVLLVLLIDVLAVVVDLRVAVAAIATGALVSAGGALYSFYFLEENRATGPLEDPNDLAYVLVAALPFVALATFRRPGPWPQVARMLCLVLLLTATAATLSRGAAVALAVALAWAIGHRLISLTAMTVGALALMSSSVLAWVLAGPAIQTALAQKSFVAQSNIDSREVRWAAAAHLLAEHPFLGTGPGGAREYYVEISNNAELVERSAVTHNMYLEVGAELGVVGLSIFVALIVVALVSTAATQQPESRRLALATQGSLLTILVMSAFLSQEYYLALWSTIAVAAALQIRSRDVAVSR